MTMTTTTMLGVGPMGGAALPVNGEWDQSLMTERLASLDRTGKRLGRLIDELNEINNELEQLDRMLFVPGLSEDTRQGLLAEMDLSIGAYNHLREAASESYRMLVLQRESCGFRNHEVLRFCYPIPELHEPVLETFDALEQEF